MAQEAGRSRLMAWNPFRDLVRVQRDLEEMFGRLPQWWSERERGSAPAVDMLDNEGEIILRADLPGMDAKDIELSVQDGTLTIRGERKDEKEEKN